jgi:hypothetical protein
MEIFKRWFSKRKGKSQEELDGNVLQMDKIGAYMMLGMDEKGNIFVACDFQDNFKSEMPKIVALFNSEQMMEESVDSIRQRCNYVEAQAILQQAAILLGQLKSIKTPRDAVVGPCDVFLTKDQNEFKG